MHDEMALTVAAAVAREAGELLRGFYRAAALDVQHKEGDARNLVTAADLAADELIQDRLRATFPDHAFLTEESYLPGHEADPLRPTWVVDPLDGTSNFAHGFPTFGVSIALWQGGEARVGVVYEPVRDWLFAARQGGGATLNGQPLAVSGRATLAETIVSCDWARLPERRAAVLAIFSDFGGEVHTLRSMGSAALAGCYVAAGMLDAYFNVSIGPWDGAAAILIAREAGGVATALNRDPWSLGSSDMLISNGHIHAAALQVIDRHWPVRA